MPSVWTRPAVAIGWKQPTVVYPLRSSSWAQEDLGGDCHDGLAEYWELPAPGFCAHWSASTPRASSPVRASPSIRVHPCRRSASRRVGDNSTRGQGSTSCPDQRRRSRCTATPGGIDQPLHRHPLIPGAAPAAARRARRRRRSWTGSAVGAVGRMVLRRIFPDRVLGSAAGHVLERSDGADLVAHHLHSSAAISARARRRLHGQTKPRAAPVPSSGRRLRSPRTQRRRDVRRGPLPFRRWRADAQPR